MQHCIHTFVSKENAGTAIVGVAALRGASACKLWQERRKQRGRERATGRGSYTTGEKRAKMSEESKDVGRERQGEVA